MIIHVLVDYGLWIIVSFRSGSILISIHLASLYFMFILYVQGYGARSYPLDWSYFDFYT